MADAAYVISIAAEMPDGATTIAELEALSAKLTGAGTKSDHFQEAIKRLGSELDAAKAAADAANAALKDGSSEYSILEREALRASKALEKAQAANVVPIDVYRRAQQANAALSEYEKKLKGLEDAAAGANGAHDKLAAGLDKVKRLGASVDQRNALLNQKYEKLGQVVSFLPGPLGRVGSSLVRGAKASHELGTAVGTSTASLAIMAVGTVVAVAAVAALTAVMVAGTVAAARYAVSVADTAREARLTREATAALNPEMAAAVGAFDAVAAATGASDDQLYSLSKALKAAKVSAADMPAALYAAAQAEAALGKGGAAEFIARVQDGTLAVGAFAAEAESKFGGVVAARLRGLDAQGKRFEKLWAGLFDGLNIEPVLDAVSVLVGMFDKGNPLAQAFGLAIEKAFGFVEKYALPAAYAVEAFALGFAIQATKIYIAVQPAIAKIAELFGLGDDSRGGRLLSVMVGLGKVAAIVGLVFGGTLLVVVGAFAGMLAFAASVAAGFALAVYGVGAAVVWAVGKSLELFGALGEAISGWYTTLFDMGANLMAGLVAGITGAVTAVVEAVTGAVGKAIAAAKDVLGIASPSKVFAEIGQNTAAGFVEGVDDGTAEAHGSMAALVASKAAAPDPSAQTNVAAAPVTSTSTSASKTIDLSGSTWTFHGVKDADTARDKFAEALTLLLEGDADSLTGAPA